MNEMINASDIFVVITGFYPEEGSILISISYEFFTSEKYAKKCYDRHHSLGHSCIMRPLHRSDLFVMKPIDQKRIKWL